MSRASRWLVLGVAGAITVGLAGGAGKGIAGVKPPAHCSRAKARPANPNGSVLVRPVAVPAPALEPAPARQGNPGAGKPGGVMMFDKPQDPAKPQSGAVVPALSAPHKTSSAASRAGLTKANQPHFGSC